MSLTSLVPAVVPSLTHNSEPVVPSSPAKKSLSPTGVSSDSDQIDLTSTVPAAVPSVFHRPLDEVAKNTNPLKALKSEAKKSAFKSTVPAAVPSLFQSP